MDCKFLPFLCFDVKIKPKIQITGAPRKKFANGDYHGYSLTKVRISLSISTQSVLYPFTLSNKMLVSRSKTKFNFETALRLYNDGVGSTNTEYVFFQLAVIMKP